MVRYWAHPPYGVVFENAIDPNFHEKALLVKAYVAALFAARARRAAGVAKRRERL